MASQETIAALKKQREEKEKKKKKKRKVGLMKMSQGKYSRIFIRCSISGPVGGQNSLSKRDFDG